MAFERRFRWAIPVWLTVALSAVFLATSITNAADGPRRPVEKIIPDKLLDECLARGKDYAKHGTSQQRTLMLSWSRGVRHEPFQKGLAIGGMPFGNGLVLSLESATPYQGKLRFCKSGASGAAVTPNQAKPEETAGWFLVEPGKKYMVTVSTSQELDTLQEIQMAGQALVDGLSVSVEPGVIGTVWVQQIENQDLPAMSLMPPGFMDLAAFPLHSLDPPVLLPDGREFKTWEQPAKHSHTYYVAQQHPQASDKNPGTKDLPWKTISRAAAVLKPGERVLVGEGIYRERVTPARGGDGPQAMVTYEAAPGQRVAIRGSERFTGKWVASSGPAGERPRGLWMAEIPKEVTAGVNPFALKNVPPVPYRASTTAARGRKDKIRVRPPYCLTQGLVFQNGRRMRQLDVYEKLAAQTGSYWVAEGGQQLHIRPFGNTDPNRAEFELTARVHAFAPEQEGLAFIRFKGFAVEYVAGVFPFPQYGAVSAMTGHHFIFEDNVIRQINALGLDFGHRHGFRYPRTFDSKPGGIGQIIRRNRFEDCGMCSMQGLGLIQGLVEDNVTVRIGWHDNYPWYESAGIKLHYCHHTLVRRNVALDSIGAPGIWIDHSNYNTRCTQNVVWGTDMMGFFFEGSQYWNMVDHNILWNCKSYGFYQHDCDRLIVANNLIGNCGKEPFRMQGGGGKRIIGGRITTCKRNRVLGNIFYAAKAQPYVKDPENLSDYNLFVDPPGTKPFDLAKWQSKSGWDTHSSQVLATLDIDRATLTLRQDPVLSCPLVPREAPVAVDFFDTPTLGKYVPLGPFATTNNKPIIKLTRGPLPKRDTD